MDDLAQKSRADRRKAISRAWHKTADANAFISALAENGFFLACDDGQSYLVVDDTGQPYSLTRQLHGVKAKEVMARLASVPPEQCPGIQDAREKWKLMTTGEVAPHPSKSESSTLIFTPHILLMCAVLLVYSDIYRNEFVYDDLSLIRDNVFLTSWRFLPTLFVTHFVDGGGLVGNELPFYRPLTALVYLAIRQTFGLSIIAFHLANVALHALNACLVYTLGRRLNFERLPTFLAVLLWALHPIQTEAVTYMSATGELLCSTFLLAGILTLTRSFNLSSVVAASLLFLCALLSKETGVVFPALVVTLLFYRSEGKRWAVRTYVKTWPFWLIAGLYLVLRGTLLGSDNFYGAFTPPSDTDVTMVERGYTFLAALPVYVHALVWPTCLRIDRAFSLYMNFLLPQVVAGFALLAAASAAILCNTVSRATPLAWGILWAAVLLSPVSGILFWANYLIAERWLYLPSAGLSLGLGETLARLSTPVHPKIAKRLVVGLAVLVASCLGVMTFNQNKVWRDSFALYNHISDCGDESSGLHNNLSVAHQEKGEYALALDEARRALLISDDNANAHYNFAFSTIFLDQNPSAIADAIKHLQRTLELNPDFIKANYLLAVLYTCTGRPTEAAEARRKAEETRNKLGLPVPLHWNVTKLGAACERP